MHVHPKVEGEVWRTHAGRAHPAPRELWNSQPSPRRKAHRVAGADDDVVEHADLHERQGVLQSPRDGAVRRAGLRDPGGVVVAQDAGGGVVPQGGPDYFARITVSAGEAVDPLRVDT